MANVEHTVYSINMFLSFLSIGVGAAMLGRSYSILWAGKYDQLVSAS